MTNKVWEMIRTQAEQVSKQYPDLIFHDEKKEEFDQEYKKHYNIIMDDFMTDNTKGLDSHKQAAIIIICCLKIGVIEHPKSKTDNEQIDDEIPLLPQIIAVNTGLSFMHDCLMERLEKRKIKKKVERYYLPLAFACNTPYEKIMCRILYFEQNKKYGMDFNILELSDRLFLLEYINLLQYGIRPSELKEKEEK